MRYLLPLALALCLIGCATSPQQQAQRTRNSRVGQLMTVRTTAYTQTEAGGWKNAIGGRLHFGGVEYSAASDWSWMPLGTRFILLSTGHEYVIEDYGSALVNKQTIDLFFPSRKQMRNWGVRHEQIKILEWGSQAMSLKLLAGRCKNSHVRVMVAQLKKQGVVPSS
ncbi:3D domain protein [Chthoniobacter flavus Ellin428]|uniref:3D domain protein n=1 Tax=Chthoniobacter flavus Ellin428 TaxID=497964 RepID=B4CZF5_9BACT|nr:3D domain-containing protein [Chthoniobacter flavus]EDY20119.1 3D domain protein [Chthoniobacter flavus Ellin428]TCO94020.1 3D (Asp-Asp-Asp) domain-containing protein [Chthoniobacter flavus]